MRKITTAFFVLACFSLACSAQDDELAKMSQAYKNGSEQERLKICIEAIDKGIICRGCSVVGMDRLFSTNFSVPDESTKGFDSLHKEIVHFRDQVDQVPSNPHMAAAEKKGWYLAFRYSESGKIVDYHLSNLGK
jgi:hypothetical protein